MKRKLKAIAIGILCLSLTVGILHIPDMLTASPKQDRKISISLTPQEWEIVLQGVAELPMKVGGNVYSSIMQQAQMQLQSQQKPKLDTTKKKP